MEYLAAVDGIARQPVGVPGKNTARLAARDALEHLVEHRTARRLGTLRLLKGGHDFKVVPLGMNFQLLKLGLNRHHLTVFLLRRFSAVDEIAIHKNLILEFVCSTFGFTIAERSIFSNAINAVLLTDGAGLEIMSLRWLSYQQPKKRKQLRC